MKLLLIACSLLMIGAPAATAEDSGAEVRAERQRIAAERARIERRYREQESSCESRFAVTACVDRAKAERREALKPLDEALQALEDARRRQRAGEQLQRIENKQREAAQRPPPIDEGARAGPAAPAESSAGAASSVEPSSPSARRSRTAGESEAQAAAERAAEAQRRQKQADAHRRAVEQRQAERQRSGKTAAPLPLPPGAAASARETDH